MAPVSGIGQTFEYPKLKPEQKPSFVPAWQQGGETAQKSSFVPAWQQDTEVKKTEQTPFLAYTVGVPATRTVEGPAKVGEVGKPKTVVDVDGTPVQYTDARGYMGLTAQAASPLAHYQAGYEEKPGFIPRELCVA